MFCGQYLHSSLLELGMEEGWGDGPLLPGFAAAERVLGVSAAAKLSVCGLEELQGLGGSSVKTAYCLGFFFSS